MSKARFLIPEYRCGETIYVTAHYERRRKLGINICPVCAEAFASAQGETCRSCQGKNYYEWNIYPNAAVK